jgi:2-C-methyl-D-erythritol 4-phosphate cytidylyltransferase
MVTAVFPAAGQGRRMNSGINKLFLKLADKPILIHTLLAFSHCDDIDDLIVAVNSADIGMVEKLLKTVPGLKPYKVIAGGAERQYSIANALSKLNDDTDIVLVHDAARPLISKESISRVVASAREHGSGVMAVREKNTIKVADENLIVKATPDRNNLWSIQTPQGFKRDLLLQAYAKAMKDDFLGTDDSSLVERLDGVEVHLVEGDFSNIKITTPEDMVVAEAFLREGVLANVVGKAADVVAGAAEFLKKGLMKK